MQCRVLIGVIALWAVLGVPAQTLKELMRRGDQAMADERYAEAAKAYQDALNKANPSDPGFQALEFVLVVKQAQAWEAKEPLRAIVLVEEALKLDESSRDDLREMRNRLELQVESATITAQAIANALKEPRRITLVDGKPVDGEPPAVHLPVNFHFNSVELTEKGKRQAGVMLEYMRDLADPKKRFRLIGHTDTQGAADYNLGLSRRRAERLREWFLARSDLDAGRIETRGLGESAPLLKGDSEAEHARNRRVQLQVLP